MAKSPSEQMRDLALEFRGLTERAVGLKDSVAELKIKDEQQESEITQLRRELAEARQENAVLRQQLQDHIAQYQEWDRRRWSLIVLLIGTVLSLASGLIVSLTRK